MNAYEEILNLMRGEGKKDNTPPIQIGEMQGEDTCKIGKLILSGNDLLIAEHLKTGYRCESGLVSPLKRGDIVTVYRMSDEIYLILERMVKI